MIMGIRKITYFAMILTVLVGCQTSSDPDRFELVPDHDNPHDYLPSSWSNYGFRALCLGRVPQFAIEDSIKKHDGKVYYNLKERQTNEESQVSFDFIADKCGSYMCKYEIKNNTLYITYYPDPSMTACDGKCDYRMIVTYVHNGQKPKTWSKVVIKKES